MHPFYYLSYPNSSMGKTFFNVSSSTFTSGRRFLFYLFFCFLHLQLHSLLIFRYKWRAVNCNGPAKFMCMVKVPNCPRGYTWLYQFGQSCFKVTPDVTYVVGTSTIGEHPMANSVCAQENTR